VVLEFLLLYSFYYLLEIYLLTLITCLTLGLLSAIPLSEKKLKPKRHCRNSGIHFCWFQIIQLLFLNLVLHSLFLLRHISQVYLNSYKNSSIVVVCHESISIILFHPVGLLLPLYRLTFSLSII